MASNTLNNMDPVTLQDVIGLPPTDNRALGLSGFGPSMHDVTKDSLPILEILPCFQKFEAGLQLYRLQKGLRTAAPHTNKSYIDELRDFYNVNLGHNAVRQNYIQFAYLNLNPPVESFTNDFEESIFAGMTDTASKGFRQAAFLANTRSLGEASKGVENIIGGIGGEMGKQLSASLGNARTALAGAAGQNPLAGTVTGAVSTAAQAATGRIDFPQFWRSSAWDPSYSVNIRLYNPFPNDKVSTEKYIIGPLAALMMFVVPRSTDGHTYHWPWLCKFRVRGLFDVQAGFVRSIQIVKGGDDNSIAMNQRVGIVDVKMELGTLYRSMVSGSPTTATDRPFLKNWLNQFTCNKEWADGSDSTRIDPNSKKPAPRGPGWVNHESLVAVGVGDEDVTGQITDQFNFLQDPNAAAAKVFDVKAADRSPDTDFASRVQQASAPRGPTLQALENVNNLSESAVNAQDLIDATDAATQSGINQAGAS
jgi:hypothetical protein